jgi:hypothetical protein
MRVLTTRPLVRTMSISRSVLFLAAVAALCGAVSAGYQKAVVIDWGNEWTKVVIMNPHAKSALSRFEMAINEQSNRKTPSVVGITGDAEDMERVMGEDAAGLLYRYCAAPSASQCLCKHVAHFPHFLRVRLQLPVSHSAPSDAFAYLKRLVGHFSDSESVQSFVSDFPANTYSVVQAPGRRTVRFARGSSSSVGVEELVVSLLQWCKRLAETHILNNNGSVACTCPFCSIVCLRLTRCKTPGVGR